MLGSACPYGGLMISRFALARAYARLTIAFALALAALTFATSAQAAAPDFTWSSTVSTAQAGGHPNLIFNYASSSTQSLTGLDVDLPQGLMHRNYPTGACTNSLYLADSCPASSTVGTITAQLVVARVAITVPGTIYQLSAPVDGADATFGAVLRPPLSSLGLTGKIFVRNQISFTNGGGLRSSLVGPLNSVTVLGASLPSRIAQLKLQYNSQRRPAASHWSATRPAAGRRPHRRRHLLGRHPPRALLHLHHHRLPSRCVLAHNRHGSSRTTPPVSGPCSRRSFR